MGGGRELFIHNVYVWVEELQLTPVIIFKSGQRTVIDWPTLSSDQLELNSSRCANNSAEEVSPQITQIAQIFLEMINRNRRNRRNLRKMLYDN